MLILLYLGLLSLNLVIARVVYPLQCTGHLANDNIYLKVNGSALPSPLLLDSNELVLQGTDVSTNESFDNDCYGERGCCWSLTEYSSGNYRLKLFNKTNKWRNELWNYGNNSFELPQDLFHCFKHEFIGFTHELLNSTTYQVEWYTKRWDEYFKLIAYHNLTLEEMHSLPQRSGHHVVMKLLPNYQCNVMEKGRKCEVQFVNLKRCVNYRVCVQTVFKPSSNSFKQCMKSYLSTHNQDCDREAMPVYAVVSAVLGALAAILGVVGFLMMRRKIQYRNSHKQQNYDDDDLISPRADYTDVLEVWNPDDESRYFVVGNTLPAACEQDRDTGIHEQEVRRWST